MKSYFIPLLILILLFCSGCSIGMNRASEIVSNSVEDSYREICDQATMFRVRENPCECDPVLKYEAFIYGHWRHVNFIGSEELLNLMTSVVAEEGEYCFFMSDELYTSKNGQQFYQLRVCDALELKTILSQ